jgi:hypothetical protein
MQTFTIHYSDTCNNTFTMDVQAASRREARDIVIEELCEGYKLSIVRRMRIW